MVDVVKLPEVTPANPAPVAEKKVKVTKPKAEPKPPRFSKEWTAESWAKRLAELTRTEVPAGWMGMAEIVKAANGVNIKTSRICTAMGGDRCANEPWAPVFQVIYVGGRKFGSPDILTDGFKLLQDPEYHKAARVGKPKADKPAPQVDADGKVIKQKLSIQANKSEVWTPGKGVEPAK